MTLLNGLLAFGGLAFTIPLAIHLLFRSRFRTVDWGAMHLLDNVVRVNRRRMELLNWLLLLLRCLLPILLAFCLARPVLTGFRSLPGDSARTLVIAIDDSRSMAARGDDGQTRMHQVVGDLTNLFRSLSRRDEVIMVRTSSLDAVVGSMGKADAIEKVKMLTASGGPVDLGRLVRRAVEVSGDAANPHRQIVVVSDFQSHMVDDVALQSLARLEPSLAGQSVRPSISFLNVGHESSDVGNVSVESVDQDSPAVVSGRSAKFTASVRNSSDTIINDVRLVWTVAGKPLPPRSITLPPRSTTVALLTHKFNEVGVQAITVAVEHSDRLPEDNDRTLAVDVIREINVLLVDGSPSNRPLQGETDFLAVALSPFAFGGLDQPDAVRTVVTATENAINEIEEKLPDLVVLANVSSVDPPTRNRLASLVLGGGSILVFDGPSVKPDSYNAMWGDGESGFRLPARLSDAVGAWSPGDDRDDVADQDRERFPIGRLSPLYSPWSIIGSSSGADGGVGALDDVEVTKYRKLVVEPSEANVLLAMASGDPLVVRARRGLGQVVQFAIPCDVSWTNLPTRLSYLPMMQQLVLDLAGSQKQTTVNVGSPISVPIRELTSLRPADVKIDESFAPSYTVETPEGVESPIEELSERRDWIGVANASLRGIYQFRELRRLVDGESVVTRTTRVAEVPAIESQLRGVDPSRLDAAAESVGATVYRDLDSFSSADQTRRFGREVWRWLLVALLCGLVGELLLEQRGIGRRKSTAGGTPNRPITGRPIAEVR